MNIYRPIGVHEFISNQTRDSGIKSKISAIGIWYKEAKIAQKAE